MTSIRKTLIDIQETQSFDRLEPFKRPQMWKTLAQDERTLLARLLVMQGAQQLSQGNHQVLESFEIAAQISSYTPEILYQQGMILASHRHNLRCLQLACQAFGHILKQDPTAFNAWYARAQVLTDIGIFEGESHYFTDAHEDFEKACALLETPAAAEASKEEFFWKWGVCLAALGKVSGEPLDFHRAMEKYTLAYQIGYQTTAFLNDYGNSFADLAVLLDKQEYFLEALKLFNQAVCQDSTDFGSWYNQACCLQRIIEFTTQEKILEQAEHSFARAAELNADFYQVWLKWGQLEAAIGKLKHDQTKLEASLEKFARAQELEPDHSQVLSCWADVELFLGAQAENLERIQSARTKILKSLELHSEDPDGWYLYGSCLNEMGYYFADEEYYYQAIEKFQYGLSISRHHPLLWYGLALSHFALGELLEDEQFYEKAAQYCTQVAENGVGHFPQFWNDWGIILLKLAETTHQIEYVEQAIEKLEHSLKQPMQNLEAEHIDLDWVYHYGCAYDLWGDLIEEPRYIEKAIQVFIQILELDPDHIQARYNLALSLSHLGELLSDVEPYYKGIEHLQYLLALDGEDEVLHLDFGVMLTNLGLLVHDVHHPEISQTLYCQAENHLMQAAALGHLQAHYQLAGLYSITENPELAMHYLERAQVLGVLPGLDELLHDDWLEGVRQTTAFRQLINALSSQQSSDEK